MTCTLNTAKPLQCCGDTILLGSLDEAATGLYAIFLNVTTGHKTEIGFDTDGDGNIIINVSETEFPTNQPYEIWIQESLGDPTRLPFTVNETEYTSVLTRFEQTTNTDGDEVAVIQSVVVVE